MSSISAGLAFETHIAEARLCPSTFVTRRRMPRAIGLDLGTKTIGVALSDERLNIAHPHQTIMRTTLKVDLKALRDLVAQNDVVHVILGLPYNMNGTEGPRVVATREFAEKLSGEISNVQIDFVDERLTTAEAQRILIEADVSRQKRKKVVDKIAAAIILQTWLDGRNLKHALDE